MKNRSALFLLLLLAGCSGDQNSAEPGAQKGHVWQEQTDMIERARGVEDVRGEANLQRRQQLDDQAQ